MIPFVRGQYVHAQTIIDPAPGIYTYAGVFEAVARAAASHPTSGIGANVAVGMDGYSITFDDGFTISIDDIESFPKLVRRAIRAVPVGDIRFDSAALAAVVSVVRYRQVHEDRAVTPEALASLHESNEITLSYGLIPVPKGVIDCAPSITYVLSRPRNGATARIERILTDICTTNRNGTPIPVRELR